MKNHALNMVVPALVALWLLNSQPSTAFAQGTAFTYQGQLQNNGALANGSYDMRFKLFLDPLGNNQAGSPVLTNGVPVANGLFIVTVDFGAGIFTGSNYWLEVDVKTNGGPTYTDLTPLQAVTPTPYSVFAENISSEALSAGAYGNVVIFNNGANQFNGTFTGNGAGLTNAGAATLGGLSATNFWLTSGNTGTSPANGNFLGTADQQPVEIRAGGLRGWRVEPDPRGDGAANLIGGFISNAVLQPFSGGDFIGGGGYLGGFNTISSNSSGDFIGAGSANQIGPNINNSFIGAGGPNTILSAQSVIVGGGPCTISSNAVDSAIVGGYDNQIFSSPYSAIVGGDDNQIYSSAPYSAIVGGYDNQIYSSPYSAIVGGDDNQIFNTAPYSIIGGGLINKIYGDTNDYGTSVIGGGYIDTIYSNSWNSFIGGGGVNTIYGSSDHSVIGGGYGNTINANSDHSVIAGGNDNSLGATSYLSVIGGGWGNVASGSGVFIGGGGYDGTNYAGNQALASASMIGGGLNNTIASGSMYSVIGGGDVNTVQLLATNATIAGGANNIIKSNALDATIGGGSVNVINANYATIGGGDNNTINANYATIPGGNGNVVNVGGTYSFCAGNQAEASQPGEFVWADSQFGTYAGSGGFNSVNFRCGGGVWFSSGTGQQVSWLPGMGSWMFTSDRNTKDRFETVDSESVLARVSQLPILEWSYKGYPQRHIGAMAQDFHALFPLNTDDKSLNDADLHGVALAAIQGLNRKLDEQISESKEKDTEIADLKQELNELKTEVKSLEQRN